MEESQEMIHMGKIYVMIQLLHGQKVVSMLKSLKVMVIVFDICNYLLLRMGDDNKLFWYIQ